MAEAPPRGQSSISLFSLSTFHFISCVPSCSLSFGVTKSEDVCSESPKHSLKHPQGLDEMAQLITKPDNLGLIPQDLYGGKRELTHVVL